jgi:hypothetical protein
MAAEVAALPFPTQQLRAFAVEIANGQGGRWNTTDYTSVEVSEVQLDDTGTYVLSYVTSSSSGIQCHDGIITIDCSSYPCVLIGLTCVNPCSSNCKICVWSNQFGMLEKCACTSTGCPNGP